VQRQVKSISNVWIDRHVLGWLCNEASRAAPAETGGVMLGYWADDVPVITHAIGPGPDASHGPSSFIPDYDYQDEEIARLYTLSNRKLAYLGDWHTHPAAEAYLSEKDIGTLRRIAAYRYARVSQPLMLILAPGPRWNPHVWQGQLKGRMFRRRKLVTQRLHVLFFDRGD
jgi:integrative and conjugative element protein (TIGR02256 family)